ncbi:MAG TPA: hypothetical protein VNV86_18545, partial [Candidatus Acidoferrum sp.]|nr:hypothetical protein [Candidatus Acidoferrum sp.]
KGGNKETGILVEFMSGVHMLSSAKTIIQHRLSVKQTTRSVSYGKYKLEDAALLSYRYFQIEGSPGTRK